MTYYLLDSNVSVRVLYARHKIAANVRAVLENQNSKFFYSVISLWELVNKTALERLVFNLKDFDTLAERSKWEMLMPTRDIYLASTWLPWLHRDPFDRVIIMQAAEKDLTILTSERKFENHGIKVIQG